MVGVPLLDEEAQYISQLRREGLTIREIAELTGRNDRTIWKYLKKEREQLWAMKTDEYWEIVEQNKERLDKIIGLAIGAIENSDGEEPAKIAAAVNAIEAQNKLLALPDFVKEQRAKDTGGKRLTIILDKDGMHSRMTGESDDNEELDGAAGSA